MNILDAGPYAVPMLAASAAWIWPRPVRGSHRERRVATAAPPLELIGACVVVSTGWLLRSPVSIALGLVAVAVARIVARQRHRQRTAAGLEDALITLVDDLCQQLRAGGALGPSFSSLVVSDPRLVTAFGEAAASISVGAQLEPELRRLAEQDRSESERLVSVALAVLAGSGGPSVPALERLAQYLRDRRASSLERRLQSSQARASAAVLGVLPIVFAAVAASLESDLRHFYLHTWLGAVCLLSMAGLLVACWLWIENVTEER